MTLYHFLSSNINFTSLLKFLLQIVFTREKLAHVNSKRIFSEKELC